MRRSPNQFSPFSGLRLLARAFLERRSAHRSPRTSSAGPGIDPRAFLERRPAHRSPRTSSASPGIDPRAVVERRSAHRSPRTSSASPGIDPRAVVERRSAHRSPRTSPASGTTRSTRQYPKSAPTNRSRMVRFQPCRLLCRATIAPVHPHTALFLQWSRMPCDDRAATGHSAATHFCTAWIMLIPTLNHCGWPSLFVAAARSGRVCWKTSVSCQRSQSS